jgi:exopolysaccharide production protein ExoZ
MKVLLSIQYLRAIAALAVVLFHAQSGIIIGQAGVDVFFVISGFVMWTVTAKPVGPGEFLMHRLVRIVPLYWIATVLMAAHQQASFSDTIRSLLFWPYQNTIGEVWPVLVQGWTLNFEMFFYAAFAASLLLPRKFQLISLTAVLGVLAAFGLLHGDRPPTLWTWANPLHLEFLAGAWISEAWLRGRLFSGRTAAAMLLLSVAGFAISAFGTTPEESRCIVWGLPAVLLVAAAVSIESSRGFPRIGLLRLLGDASYSIYLFYPFVLVTTRKLVAGAPPIIAVAATVTVCACLGVATFTFVEKPLTNWLKTHARKTLTPQIAT